MSMQIALACVTLVGVAKAQPVELKNPGFEDGLTDWSIGEKFRAQRANETFNPHSGKSSLRFDSATLQNVQ